MQVNHQDECCGHRLSPGGLPHQPVEKKERKKERKIERKKKRKKDRKKEKKEKKNVLLLNSRVLLLYSRS